LAVLNFQTKAYTTSQFEWLTPCCHKTVYYELSQDSLLWAVTRLTLVWLSLCGCREGLQWWPPWRSSPSWRTNNIQPYIWTPCSPWLLPV